MSITMTLHYHGTPITPWAAFEQLAGRCFCVSFARPDQVERAHQIGQSVMLDNGAFSLWRSGKPVDWPGYYAWAERWLNYQTTWAVVPDVIDGDEAANDALLAAWPFHHRGAPVWHLHESMDRLERLVDQWPRVCFGSSGQFAEVASPSWHRRVAEAWNRIHTRHPWIHMLRGMQCVRMPYPFASVDSTDVARNHSRPQNTPAEMAERWDAIQCPPTWRPPLHVQPQLPLGA